MRCRARIVDRGSRVQVDSRRLEVGGWRLCAAGAGARRSLDSGLCDSVTPRVALCLWMCLVGRDIRDAWVMLCFALLCCRAQ